MDWIVILLFSSVSAQYYGGYYGRYGWGTPMSVDPYNSANAYAMRGECKMPLIAALAAYSWINWPSYCFSIFRMVVDPAVSGMCVDANMQCPVWASTGQCATNGLMMRRMCALSCGTCALGMEYGMGMGMGAPGLGYGLGTGLGAASLGYAGTGLNPLATPLLGRSIYEQGSSKNFS
ncbi:ShKT domain-containing protein [Trichostrongylus colubriformis]|uniref:ShKT domain-containing protein n=1 Tax=Trichostrongylus colubriformis TaxID=6319 RepID=A0AAN8FQP9_TRICO